MNRESQNDSNKDNKDNNNTYNRPCSNRKIRPIMFVGTGSDVGKSMINAGFCRIFLQDGYSPAPFKAQNMSLNSYATVDQLEIGRAQAVQAEACGIKCSTDMNPVLLKPTTNKSAQVVLHGKPAGNQSAMEYFNKERKRELFKEVKISFDRLSSCYSPIVMEGAGSISEINLWDRDIVNMPMAEYANAATYLIADIDRGGVFASVYGSIMLLPENHRKLIKGILINKFRGDIRLFEDGREILEEITGVKVVGVIPYYRDIFIEQEDAVVIDKHKSKILKSSNIKIAVILLQSMSNFTDFNMLERTEGVTLTYAASSDEIKDADIVIIPGSKNSISDLKYLREKGLAKTIIEHFKSGKSLYGICGGFQMMGEMIYDPKHIEGDSESMAGLGIFPISTTIEEGKITKQRTFKMINGASGEGYEIHSGSTGSESPLCQFEDGSKDGHYLNEKCWGSYIHGIFDNKSVITAILKEVNGGEFIVEDYSEMKERNYNLLADQLRECVDMDYIYKTLKL